MSLCSPEQNGDDVVFFSPAEMAEEHVYLSLFPQCLWGEGATAANAAEMRPLMADTPWPRPLSQFRPYPHLDYPSPTYPPVWMKYWALDIINDKWSNCGSDDSSCKYWRKNSYHLILIIFLSFHIKQVNCACVGCRGTDAPPTLLETAERLQYFWEITMLLFIHHYVIMNHFIWTFKFIITRSTDVITVNKLSAYF